MKESHMAVVYRAFDVRGTLKAKGMARKMTGLSRLQMFEKATLQMLQEKGSIFKRCCESAFWTASKKLLIDGFMWKEFGQQSLNCH